MCKAAKISIAEVEEIVAVGQLDPDHVHVPGIYVDRIIKGAQYEKRIEVCSIFLINTLIVLKLSSLFFHEFNKHFFL